MDTTQLPVMEGKPWYTDYPQPRTIEPDSITREELLWRFKQRQEGERDFLLVDVRRDDHKVRQIVYCSFPHFFSSPFVFVFRGSRSLSSRDGKELLQEGALK